MKGYIAKYQNSVLSDQEVFDNFVVGEGSKWAEAPPFDGQVFNCTLTDAPYPSWVFNKAYCQWQAPVPVPADAGQGEPPKRYTWNEATTSWVEVPAV